MVVFHWSVVGCNNTNEKSSFYKCQVFISDITFFSAHLYMIKMKCWHTQHITINQTRKKQPMDYDNVERWYNIGITPIQDYIDSSIYPRITATIQQ